MALTMVITEQMKLTVPLVKLDLTEMTLPWVKLELMKEKMSATEMIAGTGDDGRDDGDDGAEDVDGAADEHG